MKHIVFGIGVAIGLALLSVMPSHAEPAYKISWGSRSGTCFRVGLNAAELVPGGFVDKSRGSVGNLDRAAAGTHQFAPVQLDALAWWSSKYPDKAARIEALGPLCQECAYVAVNCKGKVGDEDDLGEKGVTVTVDKKGSGPAVSWDYMRQRNEGYKKAAVVPKGGSRALGQLESSTSSGLDAVFCVTKPYPLEKNKNLQAVLRNENLCMIDLNDYSLNNVYEPLGKPIYTFEKIDIAKGAFNDTELFTENVREYYQTWFEDSPEPDEKLWERIENEVLYYANDGIHAAREAANNFEHEGFRFVDFRESNNMIYTYHHEWCCRAIVRAIGEYNKRKTDG